MIHAIKRAGVEKGRREGDWCELLAGFEGHPSYFGDASSWFLVGVVVVAVSDSTVAACIAVAASVGADAVMAPHHLQTLSVGAHKRDTVVVGYTWTDVDVVADDDVMLVAAAEDSMACD